MKTRARLPHISVLLMGLVFTPSTRADELNCYEKTDSCQTAAEVFVQKLDENLRDGLIDRGTATRKALDFIDANHRLFDHLNLALSLQDLMPQLRDELEGPLFNKTFHALVSNQLDQRTAGLILSHQDHFPEAWKNTLQLTASLHPQALPKRQKDAPKNRYEMARDLVQMDPPIGDYFSGRYLNKPRLYMFCRDSRNHPCLMIMRNQEGEIHRQENGEIWHQPSLGLSRHNKKYYQTNGHTPAGVWRIDGVMPEANEQLVFGKFRRLILNFVGASPDEQNMRKLLPASSHGSDWWQENVTARNNGRGLFRIHGTGLRSSSLRPYFPLVPTSGCVAQRENTYDKISYKDQRLLLDELMAVSKMPPTFENEAKILGLLYVFNLDDEKRAVELTDLQAAQIL